MYYEVFWYDGINPAKTIYTNDIEAASQIALALKMTGCNVIVMSHTKGTGIPLNGYEEAYEKWIEACRKG